MSLAPQDADELLALLSGRWNGSFTAESLTRIEEIARNNGDSAIELLIKFSAMHADLEAVVASSQACDLAIDRIRRSEFSRPPSASALKLVATDDSGPRRRARISKVQAMLIVAASLVLAVGSSYWLDPHVRIERPSMGAPGMPRILRPPQTVACVTRLTNATWSRSETIAVGQTLKQNQRLELLSGDAQLSMACGADIVLQAPCTIKLKSDDFVFLEQGDLTVEVAKWATGFVVDTKGLRITDLGTRFAVSAGPTGVAEAHVLEGEVLAEPMKAHRPRQASMLLAAGEAIRVSLPQATIDQIIAESDRFVSRLQQFRPLRPIQLRNTGIGRAVGQDDSHWVVTAGDPAYGPYPHPAVVTEGDPSYLDNMPDGSQWISVKKDAWPGVPTSTTHTFETRFDLTGYDLSTVRIIGSFLVDNAINELRINGRPVSFNRWVTTWDVHDFESFHTIEIVDGLVPGENVISIDVFNTPSHPDNPELPNPMGLRVEWQAFGCEAKNVRVPVVDQISEILQAARSFLASAGVFPKISPDSML
jgi:ferric-dicitrate binding protein FerR (iron transport regulator)